MRKTGNRTVQGGKMREDMTSEERREARYQRRKKKREDKKEARAKELNFEEVFSYKHLYSSYKKCRRTVGWKASTQKYIVQAPLEVHRTHEQLQKGKFKSDGFYEFDLYERGKHRHIRSVTMKERVVQRCLCDYSLVPTVGRTFIYDNSASLENKGYHFAIGRIVRHLQYHYRKHGTEGYILLFDFHHFFDSVSHAVVRKILEGKYDDKCLLNLTMHFVDAFGEVGMGLGSQISQTLALASANKLDHAIKELMRIRCYARYMDDGYLIHVSKEYLQKCLEQIKAICEELSIELNEKKTQIVKLSHGFTWLKTRFFLLPSGEIVRKIYKRSVTKMRQKLKSFKKLVNQGKMEISDVKSAVQSWMAYALHFDACMTIKNIIQLIYDIYGKDNGYKILSVKKIKRNSIYKKRKYAVYMSNQIYRELSAAA